MGSNRLVTQRRGLASHTSLCALQVGHAAGVAHEAAVLVEQLRVRLRAVAAAVAPAQRRPRVLSLEGITPLVLGQWEQWPAHAPCLMRFQAGQGHSCCRPALRQIHAMIIVAAAGGCWLPDVKQLAGGLDEWQQPGDPPLRITWDQASSQKPAPGVLHTHFPYATHSYRCMLGHWLFTVQF